MTTETSTPSQPAPPSESQPARTPAPFPTLPAAAPPDLKRLQQGVQRTVQARSQEKAWQQEKASLEPLRQAQALMKEGRVAEAVQLMTGKEGFVPAYQSLTQAVLGQQEGEEKWKALPPELRAHGEQLKALQARDAEVKALQEKVEAFERRGQEAQQQLQAQRQQKAVMDVFDEGLQSAQGAMEELGMLPSHPEGARLVYAKWQEMWGEREAELKALPPAQRKPFLSQLVAEAMRRADAELIKQHEWVLSAPHARRTLGAVTPAVRVPAPQSPASAPPPRQPAKVSPPGSLGEPSGVDWSKLSHDERIERMRAEERNGLYRP